MTGTTGGGRQEIERRIIQRSLRDEDFRRMLLADPRSAIEQELGTPLPAEVEIRAVEETADTIYLVLPGSSADDRARGELSDRDLEAVAGGDWGTNTCGESGNTCQYTCGC